MTRLAPVGRAFFAIAMIGFGLLHIVHADFATRLVPTPHAAVPGRAGLAWAVGVFLIATGVSVLARRYARPLLLMLAAGLFVSVAAIYLPRLLPHFTWGDVLTNTLKIAAIAGGALAVARTLPGGADIPPVGRFLFALFVIVGGIEHFIFAQFVATLVPAWVPGHAFWTYFTGCALIAAGVGVLVPQTARLAGALAGAMIFAWVVLLHVPRALANPQAVLETAGVFEALCLSGVALVLAATPWPKAHEKL